MKLIDLCEKRLKCVVSPTAASTKAHYRRSVRMFSDFLERTATTDDLTPENIIGFANDTVAKGNTHATGNQRIKQLRALWEWGARTVNPATGNAYLANLPTRHIKIKCPKKNPHCWRPDELKSLFEACGQMPGWIGPHKASSWWLALHWWLYNTGERIEATMLLRPSMIDLNLKTAEVPAEIRKGGMMPMQYVLSDRGVEALAKVLSRAEEFVFEHQWQTSDCIAGSGFYPAYRRLTTLAGLPYVRGKTGPHKMRRTVASFVSAMGGNASFFLGHAPKNVAEESYIDRAFVMAHQQHLWPTDSFDPIPKRDADPGGKIATSENGKSREAVAMVPDALDWL